MSDATTAKTTSAELAEELDVPAWKVYETAKKLGIKQFNERTEAQHDKLVVALRELKAGKKTAKPAAQSAKRRAPATKAAPRASETAPFGVATALDHLGKLAELLRRLKPQLDELHRLMSE